jgi:hypothetical protein
MGGRTLTGNTAVGSCPLQALCGSLISGSLSCDSRSYNSSGKMRIDP